MTPTLTLSLLSAGAIAGWLFRTSMFALALAKILIYFAVFTLVNYAIMFVAGNSNKGLLVFMYKTN